MLKNKLLSDYKEELQKKYGYSDDFAETIVLVGEAVVDELGEEYEDIAFEAISNTRFEKCRPAVMEPGSYVPSESAYDVLVRTDMYDDIEGTILTDKDLKRTIGVNTAIPRISFDGTDYHIDRVDRIVVSSSNTSLSDINSISILAHEMLHAVKSYVGQFKINGDILTERTDIGHIEYKLSVDENNNVKRSLISEIGNGLSEALNSYDELHLMQTSFDSNHEVYAYRYQQPVGAFLKDMMGLRDLIVRAQMTGNEEELKRVIDENMSCGYEEFLRLMDDSAKLEYDRVGALLDQPRYEQILEAEKKHFETVIAPATREFSKNLQEKSTEYGIRKSA